MKQISRTHILIVSQYFYPETFRINDMAEEWVKRGYKITVLTGIPNYPAGKFYDGYDYKHRRKEYWNGIKIIRIPLIPRGKSSAGLAANYISFAAAGFIWNIKNDIKADYVFTFEVSPMTQALIGVWYAKKNRIPHYLYVQDLWPENIEAVMGIHNKAVIEPINRMADYIYKNSKKIFVTSPGFAEAVAGRKVPVARNKILYWPQYAEEFYRPLDREKVYEIAKKHGSSPVNKIPDDDSFKIVFTGAIGYAQGLDILPKTALVLKNKLERAKAAGYFENRDVRFIVVGEGRYQKELEDEVEKLGIKNMFIMIPKQPAEIIPEILAVCDVAFLSFKETKLFELTIPAKLQSYMACGMPVLAAAKGETQKVIEEAGCGICVEIGNSRACAAAICHLMKENLKGMGENSARYFEKYFNKKMLMDKMCRFFRKDIKAADSNRCDSSYG